MKKNGDIIQMAVLAVFGIGIVLGVLFFSGKVPLPGDKKKDTGLSGSITIWGVLPYGTMKSLTDTIEQQNRDLKITYQEKKPETIQDEFVNALSVGKGPDVIVMAPGIVAENVERLMIIPYANYPDTVFKNTFIDSANDFLTTQGILALPLFVEPMVMFYNKDLLADEFLVNPPTTWNGFTEQAITLTKKDDAGKISQSGAALGTANNIPITKDIITLKSLQDGEQFVVSDPQVGTWVSTLGNSQKIVNTFSWYLGFSDKNSDHYTWNTSLLKDRDMFTAGKLAFYFGYPYEYQTIMQKNPNLNFAMTMVPQSDTPGSRKINYARVYSVGVPKTTKNPKAATGVMNLLTQKENVTAMVSSGNYAPARRDMLSEKPKDNANLAMIYQSAIISKSFFDPNSRETTRLISTAIESVNAGSKSLEVALVTFTNTFSKLVADLKLPVNKTE